MANVRDVAKLAHSSVATVSAVINNSRYVSPGLHARVLRAIKRLNYRPDGIARSLSTRRTKTLGVIIPNILSPVYPPIVKAIEQEVMRDGFSLLLATSDDDPARERELIELMGEKRVDGLIISVAGEENVDELEALSNRGVHVVLVSRAVRKSGLFDTVVSDCLHGSYIAVMDLFDSGCRDIGILVLTPRASSERERIAGYKLAHRKRGVAIRPELGRRCVSSQVPNSAAICYAATTDLLCLPCPPDALFVANQTLMISALRALGDLGLRIPEDVAVIGFGDDPWLERVAVPVSAIAERREHLGARAAQLLLRRLRGDRPPDKPVIEVVPTQLVVRASTANRSRRDESSLSPRLKSHPDSRRGGRPERSVGEAPIP